MITEKQKALVQSTWAKVVPIQNQAASPFYGRLFELDPSVKPMFKSDISEQGAKLMKTLGFAVNSLNDLEALLPALQDLSKRHVGYGVKPVHYGTVGAALLWTLEQGLGDAFTPEVKEAWTDTYGLVSKVMIEAASEAA